MEIKSKKCKFCGNKGTQNLSGMDLIHIFCPKCKGHYYRDKWYTRKEWEKWVNEI